MDPRIKQNSANESTGRVPHWLLCLLLLFPFSCQAAENVLILLSENAPAYLKVANEIVSNGPPIDIETSLFSNLKGAVPETLKPYSTIVPIGAAATEFALATAPPGTTLICSFLPRSVYRLLLHQYDARIKALQLQTSAIFLDQPYTRQLALARIIKPDFKWLGVILGPSSKRDLDLLQQAALQLQVNLTYDSLEITDNPVRRLQPLMEKSDMFIALPDQAIFNQTTAKWLLYMSYRKQIPLISFSRSYVEAGAIAAVISSPEQVGQHTAELISILYQENRLPEPQHSKYFSVTTNPQAARKLNIALPDPLILQRLLMEAEH